MKLLKIEKERKKKIMDIYGEEGATTIQEVNGVPTRVALISVNISEEGEVLVDKAPDFDAAVKRIKRNV